MSAADAQALLAAAQRAWEIVVVGAGPAGALAAHRMASLGLSVLLVDRARFPRRKVCGCCLNPRALHALTAAGLGALPAALGAVPLRRLHLAVAGRAADIDLPGGVALSREALDTALAAAACARGATFLAGVTASSGGAARDEPGGTAGDGGAACDETGGAADNAGGGAAANATSRRTVRLRRAGTEVEVQARVVLVAEGLAGRFFDEGAADVAHGARVGAGAIAARAPDVYHPGTVFMACARAGYVGLVRLEDGRLDVAAALDGGALRGAGVTGCGSVEAGGSHTVGVAAARVLAAAGLPPVPDLADLPWHGTPALTRRARRLAAPRAFLIGDACGYVEPFTGEGIAWALASALAVTPFALAAARAPAWDPSLESAWTAEWRRVVGRRQWLCRATARVLRHPTLAALSVAVLAARPGLGAPLLARLAAPDRWPAAAGATRA